MINSPPDNKPKTIEKNNNLSADENYDRHQKKSKTENTLHSSISENTYYGTKNNIISITHKIRK